MLQKEYCLKHRTRLPRTSGIARLLVGLLYGRGFLLILMCTTKFTALHYHYLSFYYSNWIVETITCCSKQLQTYCSENAGDDYNIFIVDIKENMGLKKHDNCVLIWTIFIEKESDKLSHDFQLQLAWKNGTIDSSYTMHISNVKSTCDSTSFETWSLLADLWIFCCWKLYFVPHMLT